MEDDPNHELRDLANRSKQSGIFPGRCGDTSPHEGVLNIPLGSKVTPHDVGLALISRVTPRVNDFSPDLIILSAGFDAHKCDPMGLGGLSASDFGHITEVACKLAFRSCSGRVLSILEGGYGVPCCRPQRHDYPMELASNTLGTGMTGMGMANDAASSGVAGPVDSNGAPDVVLKPNVPLPQPSKLLDLGEDLPSDMDDQVPFGLQRRLEKCHAEGFVECVYEHVQSLARCNKIE